MSAETRLWQYRRGEARIFESRKEIPDGEGWQDLPVKEAQNGTSTDNPSQQARVAADESANASGVEGAKGDGAGKTGENQDGKVLDARLASMAAKLDARTVAANAAMARASRK